MHVIYPISSLIYSVFKLQWLCASLGHFSLFHNTVSKHISKTYLCFRWHQRISEAGREFKNPLGHPTTQSRSTSGGRPDCSQHSPVGTLNPSRTESNLQSNLMFSQDWNFFFYLVWYSLATMYTCCFLPSLLSPSKDCLVSAVGSFRSIEGVLFQADPAPFSSQMVKTPASTTPVDLCWAPFSLSMSSLLKKMRKVRWTIWMLSEKCHIAILLTYRLCHGSYGPGWCCLPSLPANTMD